MLFSYLFFHLSSHPSEALKVGKLKLFANWSAFSLSIGPSIGTFWLLWRENHLKTALSIWGFFYFFSIGFLSWTLTTHRTAGQGRRPFFIPLYHFLPLTNIQTFICNFACEIPITYHILIATLVFTRLLLVEIFSPYRITIWLIDDVKFALVCLLDDLILGFCYSSLDTGNQWTWTCIDYHPCITSEPTNPVS